MQSRPPKLSADDPWKHDMFASQNNIEGGTLGARLAVPPKSLPTSNSGEIVGFQKALAAVNGRPVPSRGLSSKEESFNIRGASGVTVEVRELVQGTTAADVEVRLLSSTLPIRTERIQLLPGYRRSSSAVEL